MSPMRTLAGRLVPRMLKQSIGGFQRRRRFGRALRKLGDLPPAAEVPAAVWHDLIRGWANEGWSAGHEYLGAVRRFALQANGPVLECGSGLTTLLLGLMAQRTGNPVWTLEHHADWAERISAVLKQRKLERIELCVADLRDYGSFTWYDPPLHRMPADFALVICDGPPGDTPGGRSGLLPVMRDRLRPGCVILADDVQRAEDRGVLDRWAGELGAGLEVVGLDKPFALLRMP